MAVLIEFFSVVVPKTVLLSKYPGGIEQYKEDSPYNSYLEDEHLTRVGFMADYELAEYCEGLITKGFHFDEANNSSTEFVVIQNMFGLRWNVSWVELREDGCAYFIS